MTKIPDRRLPGIELPPLAEPDGSLGPYARSGLRTIVGNRINPLAKDAWYDKGRQRISSSQSPVITGAHPQLEAWLQAMGGLDPKWNVRQNPAHEWPLSAVIPRVKAGREFPPWPLPQGSYWVDYEAITASTQKLPETPWTHEIAEQFPDGSQVILGSIGELSMRLTLWKFRQQLWTHPFVEQFHAIVCPDFSSYLDDPRPQAAVGERMTQIFIEMGHAHGYQMIPILSWQNATALRRQADLFGAMYPQVNTIYIELLSRAVDRTAWLFTRLDEIEEHLSHLPFRFLFSGVDAGWAVRELRRIFPAGNFHMVTIWPWMKTSFTPGIAEQKSRTFRRNIRKLEDFHRGEYLPAAKARPENMTLLLWQREEAEKKAQEERAQHLAEKARQEAAESESGEIDVANSAAADAFEDEPPQGSEANL